MILIDNLLEQFAYRVTGGCQYAWNCLGTNSHVMDFNRVSVTFQTTTKEVTSITVLPVNSNHAYTWVSPKYVTHYLVVLEEEVPVERRNQMVYSFQAIMQMANDSIVDRDTDLGLAYCVDVDLTDEQMTKLEALATQRGMKMEDLVNEILQQAT